MRTLGKGILDTRITHRFGNVNIGPHRLYGMDDLRDDRLAIEYGITDRLSAGFGRNKGDHVNSPQQQIIEIFDLYFKYRALYQSKSNEIPVSLSLLANTAFTGMEATSLKDAKNNFEHYTDRFSFVFQLLAARKFGEIFSFQVMPTYLRRNWALGPDEKDLISIGAGGRLKLSPTLGLVGEYFYTFSKYRRDNPQEYSDHLGVALEINTGGHVFTINFTNSTGIIPNTFIPYTTSSWLDGGFRLGFEISRSFIVYREKK